MFVNDPNVIARALAVLRRGGVIVYPTETAYGLGGDWTKQSVHRRIRLLKGRPTSKQLSVIISSQAMAEKYVHFSVSARELAKKYWPGPLSLVVPLKKGKGTLSIRISPHPIARQLVRKLGRPLIATSANISGGETLYRADDVVREFSARKHKPDLIIDAGALPKRRPSTIVQVFEDGSCSILREGPIKINPKY